MQSAEANWALHSWWGSLVGQ